MNTMQKFSMLFLVSITISSFAMEQQPRTGLLARLFASCRYQGDDDSTIPSATTHVTDDSATTSASTPFYTDDDSSTEEGDWFERQVAKVFTSLEDQYESVEGSSVKELEQVLYCAPEEAKDLLETFLNPRGQVDRAALLVGEPGFGKTTLGKGLAFMAHKLKGWKLFYFSSADFGNSNDQRNSSGNRLRETLERIVAENEKVIVILDEINIILDNHKSEHHDTGNTAVALWTFLDRQRHKGNFFLIGIANEVDGIPEPLKERVRNTTIALQKPKPEMRRRVFRSKIDGNRFIILDAACDDNFFAQFLVRVEGWSDRSVEKIIETAQAIAHRSHRGSKRPALVKPEHFEEALAYLVRVGENNLKFGKQKETPEQIQERHHRENIKLQKQGQELQDQHFAQNAYIQIMQSKQATMGYNGGLSLGASTQGPSGGISLGASYSSQSITQEGIEGIIRMLSNKQKAYICKQFDADFKKQCQVINSNIVKCINTIHALKQKNLKEYTTYISNKLSQSKRKFKTIQKRFKAAKARLDVDEAASVAVNYIKDLQKTLSTFPKVEDEFPASIKWRERVRQSRIAQSQNNSAVSLIQGLLDGKLLDTKADALSVDNSWCTIL